MNISNFLELRNTFYSDVESISDFDTVGNITPSMTCISDSLTNSLGEYLGLTITAPNLKSFLGYLVGVHQYEPLFSGTNLLVNITNIVNADEQLYFTEFDSLTTISGISTFKFKPAETVDKISLGFYNLTYQGEPDSYSPFGFVDIDSLDTKLTATRNDIINFFNTTYKSKFLRGSAKFSRTQLLDKGYIIELLDQDAYIVVVEINLDDRGIHNYEAIVVAKKDL